MSSPNEQPNASAIEAINRKLTEVTSLAEQLDSVLRTAQDSQNENASRSLSSEDACTEDVRSESEDFITASECTCTPQSRSSSYHTASECGTSPWLDQELDSSQNQGITSTPITSPIQHHQSISKLVREITETRTFKVRQCHVTSNASLVRTEDEFKSKEKEVGDSFDMAEQSGEWITVKLVEAQPDLTSIGNNLQEAVDLQTAHNEVLRQLKNKVTPVEELMRQVDKKVSSQRPEPEVYAAMAESLGTAWQSINRHLEHRKQILDLSVAFQTNFELCLQRMEALDIACHDQELPLQIKEVKETLTEIHDLRRLVLESVMAVLQDGGHLLDHLKDLNNIGTLDSRPGQIKSTVGTAIKQIESWLEMMHDRRGILEMTWQGRKNRLEQCLALAMLAKDLHELEDAICDHKERLGSDLYLGETEYETSKFITEIFRILKEVKELQERAIKITRATEQLVRSGCFAGREASDKAYSVLGGCSDFINDLETRELLLSRAQTFYENGRQTLIRLDDFEREVRQNDLVGMLPRLTPVTITNAVDDMTLDVIREGKDLLTECGINNPGSQGIRKLLEEIENRAIELRRKCDEMRRTDRKIGEALFAFQEKQDELSNWLLTVTESTLKEQKHMGHDLPTAKSFCSFHHELLKDLEIKGNEINALLLTLPPILEYLDDEQRKEVDRKVENLHENWTTLKALIELRLDFSAIFVQFLTDAERLNVGFENLDCSLIRSSSHSLENKIKLIDEQWNVIKPMYDQLKNSGTGFKKSAEQRAVTDRYLAIGAACSLIEEILNSFSSKEFRLVEQQETWRTQITTIRQVYEQWRTVMDQTRLVIDGIAQLENDIYPVLKCPTANSSEVVVFVENNSQRITQELKQAQNSLETKIRLTEDLVSQDASLFDETQPVKENLQRVQQKLNTTITDYQLLLQLIISFFRNVYELDKSIENVQNKYGLPVDLQTDLEDFSKDHDASKKIVMEMFKLVVNESNEVINRIRQQEPKQAAEYDIEKILSMLEQRKTSFECSWNSTKLALDESIKTGQFDVDLKDLNCTLDDLAKQLSSMRGQYGETLATTKASSLAFEYFERTIELLQNKIDGFISTTNEMFSSHLKEYPRIKRDLETLEKRWSDFRKEVSEVRKLIDLRIQYFKLVDEADDWFREGNKLIVTIASKTTTIKTEYDAHVLLSEMEQFITSGEPKQNERLQKMSALAREMYDDSRYLHLNKIQNENREMVNSFKTVSDNLRTAIEALKKAAKQRDEVDRSLEEKTKLETELLAQTLIVQKKLIQTTTSESQTMEFGKAPEFITKLTDAVVPEGSKFTFECQVIGDPEPDISWYKDGMSIQNNPDYKTIFENGKCSLTIEETFTEDSAKFKCKASNRYGFVETNAVLSVRETDVNALLQPPHFVELLKPGKAVEGKKFQFECKVMGNPLPTVQWFKNDVCIDNSSDYAITYNNGEAVLRFEEVFLEDHALYMCKASNDAGIDQCQAYLTVEPLEPTEKPVFIVPLSNTMARAGQKVRLECEIAGIPQPQISWTHNGKPFVETPDMKLHRDSHSAILVINEAFPKDAGLYTVTARNIAGTVSSSCNVSVKGILPNETSDSEQPSDMEPIKPSIQMPLQDRTAFERECVRFDCIIVGQPEPEVIWYHNDKPVKESSEFQLLFQGDRCSLIIQEVFTEDAGVYKVVAINSAGESSSMCTLKVDKPKDSQFEQNLQIGVSPKFTRLLTDILVSENEKVVFECEVSGDPKPDVKWYHNSKEIVSNDRYEISITNDDLARLIIHQAQPDDKGMFTIKAINSCGDAKCFAQLIVKSVNAKENEKSIPVKPEYGSVAPAFKELFSDSKVPNGCSAKFECIVTGKPVPKIKWLFNDLPVSGKNFLISSCGDRHILAIPTVTSELKGNISCVAENDVGRATCIAFLGVDDSKSQNSYELIFPQDIKDSTSMFMKQEIITQSSSHSSTTYGSGEPKTEVHQVTSQSHSTAQQINDDPPIVTKSEKIEEYHQSDKEPASARKETVLNTTVDRNTDVMESIITKVEPIKAFHHVRKSVSPRFVSPLVGKIVDQGASIVLEGIVDGYPVPDVKWTKNGQDLRVGGNITNMTWELNKAKIVLENVDIDDAGRFTCTATNSAGVASSTADIVIKKSIFPPVFGRRLQAQVVKKGDRVVMEVEVAGTPEPVVTWYKDNKPIEEAMASHFKLKTQGLCHSLVINEVGLDDSGKYMVRAINAGGEAQSIADFAVFEPTPETMVEVVKTMVYEDLQNQPKKDSLVKNITMTSREIKMNEKLEPFPFKPDALKQKRVACPPPPSPSKFVKGEFRESDYESDYDSRIPAIWRPNESDTDEKIYRPVRISLHTLKSGRHSRTSDRQKSPTPPTEFDNPPEFIGPPRPKFTPINKLETSSKITSVNKLISKQQIYKPTPVSAKPTIQDHIIVTPAVQKDIVLQPGPQPEIGYISPPKRTQYYTGTAGIPIANAVETSKTMHFNESTERSHRVLNISQTTRVIKFEDDSKKEAALEPFPFKPDPDIPKPRHTHASVPKPKKFIPGEFRESDYESEVESTRIRAKWAPLDSDSEEPYYRKVRAPVFTRSASLPRSYGRVMTPMEFDTEPPVMPIEISKTMDTRQIIQTDQKRNAKKHNEFRKETSFSNVATSIANSHMSDMSQMFKSKVHRFADDVLTDVKQSKQQKPILKTPQLKGDSESTAQAYKEESRFAQYGTKHIDPDTGLIYFKYDFGYEFGILFPGEGKKIMVGESSSSSSCQNKVEQRKGDIQVPIIHEKSNGIQQSLNTVPLCKKSQGNDKNVKWESGSEWSETEDIRHHGGWRCEQTPSPKSLSPSIPSQSPRYFYQPDPSDRSCASTPASSRVYSTGQNGEIAKPPYFITPLKDIAAVSGQPARFECIVQSEPTPSIVWAKNGRILQPTMNHETYFRNGVCRLTLLKAHPDDGGTYTCTAKNCAGAVGCSATLQVPGERWSTYLRKT